MYARIDLKNFNATCEQGYYPALRGKPIVVYNESAYGNQKIIAVSKEAKKKRH